MTDSVWRRSMLVTAVRELDGSAAVIVQGDQAMQPIRLRVAHSDSCCIDMRFDVGGVAVPPVRVWITTVEPQRPRPAALPGFATRHRPAHGAPEPGGILAWLRRLFGS